MGHATPIAGPSIPRSLISNTLITNAPAPTSTSTQSANLQHTNRTLHSQAGHPPKPQPTNQLVRIRLADHLLAAPGVSFARSLAAYSSPYGTVRTSESIIRTNHRLSAAPSNSKPATPPSVPHPAKTNSPTPSQPPPESPASPSPPPALPEQHSEPKPPSIQLHPPPPSSAASQTPSISKPKSWADLLRRPPSTGTPANNLPTPSPNTKNLPLSTKAIQPVDLNQPLPLSEKINLLRATDQPSYLIPRGLVNNGNICFANAILQVLVHCSPFFNLLSHIGRIVAHDFKSQTPLLDAMIAFLHEFQTVNPTELQPIPDPSGQPKKYQLPTSAAHLRQGDPFIAESVWMATKDNFRFDAMRRGQQEDAQEFLCFFLDSLHEELLFLTNKHDSSLRNKLSNSKTNSVKPPPHLSANEALNSGEWLEVGAKGQAAVTRSMDACPSPLTEIFDLKTRSVLHRPGQKDSVTFEPTNMLQLSIEHPSITTIEQALAHFSSPDVISDMVSKNGQRVSATKQVYIESFPPVLVLHLKRFNYNNKDGTVHKSNKQIRFGAELKIPQLVMSPAHRSSQNSDEGQIKFKLFAVVYHHGPHASGGHYTVLIRQPLIDSWIYIDDTQITSILNPDLMLSSASDGGIDSQINPSPSSCHTRPNDQAHNSTDSGRSSVAHAHHNHTNSNGHGGGNTQNIKTPYLLFYTRA